MISIVEIIDNIQNEKYAGLIEDLNFYGIEIKLYELELEKLVMAHRYNQEIMKQVEHYQNQFIIQQNNLSKLKYKVKQIDLLTWSLEFPEWKRNKFYGRLSEDVALLQNCLNELFFSMFLPISDYYTRCSNC